MATESQVIVRFSTRDTEQVVKALEAMGDAGQKHLAERLARAMEGPTAGQKALNAAVEEGRGKFDEFARALGPVGNVLTAIGPKWLAVAGGIGLAAEGLKKYFEVALEQESNQARLNALLKATGDTAGRTAGQINALAEEISTSTMATKDDVEAAASTLLTFQSVAGDVFDDVLRLSQDLAATGFGNLQENAIRLGRALEDPVNGLDSLRRIGIAFAPVLREQIEAMAKAGDVAGAQAAMIDALKDKVGGVGAAQNDTLTGAFHEMTSSYQQWLEQVATTEPVKALIALMHKLGEEARGAAEAMSPLGKAEIAAADAQGAYSYAQAQALSSRRANGSLPAALQTTLEQTAERARATAQIVAALKGEKVVEEELAQAAARKNQLNEQAARTADLNAKAIGDRIQADLELSRQQEEAATKAAEQAKQENDQREQAVTEIQTQANAAHRLFDAYVQGQDVYEQVQLDLKVEANLRKLVGEATDKQRQAVVDATIEEANFEKALKQRQASEQLTAQYVQDAAQKQAQARQQMFQSIQQTATQAGSHVVDAFISMAEGAKNPFDSLLSYARKTFEQIAAAALLNPIVIPMFTSLLGGAAGISGGGAAGGSGTLAAGSNLVSLGGGIYTLSGGSSGFLSGVGGTISNSINSFGANVFGTGAASNSVPLSQLGTANLTGATLSSILGAGAIGAVGGGLIANMLGMRNPTGASIGSGVGAAAGMAFLPGLIGVSGPIGAVIGGLVGLLGGLFGGKPSDKTGEWGVNNILSGEGLRRLGNVPGTAKFSQENDSAASQGVSTIMDFVKQFASATGGTFAGSGQWGNALNIKVGDRDGIRGTFGDNTDKVFGSIDELQSALVDWVVGGMKNLPADVATAMSHIDFHGDLTAAFDKVTFAKNFQNAIAAMTSGSLDIQKDAYTQAKVEVQTYVEQIRQFKTTTHDLGLSIDDANAATKSFVQNLVGMATGDQGLTTVESAVKKLNGVVAALPDLLAEVGETGYTAQDILAKGLAVLRGQVTGDLTSRLNAASGHAYLNDIGGAIGSYNTDVRNLAAVGLGNGMAMQVLTATARGIIADAITGAGTVPAATEAVMLIKDAFKDFPDILAIADDALAHVNDTLGITAQQAEAAAAAAQASAARIQSMAQDLANAQRSVTQGLYGRYSNIASSADDALLTLSTDSSLSGLGPEAQRANLLGALQGAFADSQSSDKATAAAGSEKVLQLWQPFLEASKTFYRTSTGFYQDQALVKNMLGQTKSLAQTQVDLLAAQLDRLDQLIALAGGKTNVSPIGGTTASDLRAAEGLYGDSLKQYLAGGGTESQFVNSDTVQNVLVPLRDQLIGGITNPQDLINTIQGARQMAGNPLYAGLAASQEAAARARAAQLGVALPFANGGVVDGPTFAILGEGRYRREAAIPLPDGRAVHAVVHDGGQAEVVDLLSAILERLEIGNRNTSANLSVIAGNTASTSASLRRRA